MNCKHNGTVHLPLEVFGGSANRMVVGMPFLRVKLGWPWEAFFLLASAGKSRLDREAASLLLVCYLTQPLSSNSRGIGLRLAH